ncbi:MAG: transcriptional repressor [Kofleriaceae bacterium]|nr:transcriptional repressor [Kofleriaceae bacterium]MCL4227340.1 transcriptional repressor [Myxococcales bacterium]
MATRKEIDALRRALRERGLRATPSRLAVLGLLRRHGGPLSHAEAADRLHDLGWDRATIYRNLIDLSEAGLARRSDVGDHTWRFEAVDVAHADDRHAHFVCTGCGTVACLPDVDLAVGKAAPRAVKQKQVEVQVRGLCDGCEP